MEKIQNNNEKTPPIFLIISGFFLFLNFVMGDTILANVLVLFISFVTGVISIIRSLITIAKEGARRSDLLILFSSIVIVIFIFCLVFFDGIPMGYGP